MPIFEYICQDCGRKYEKIVLSASQPVACPHCSSTRKAMQLSVFSAPAKSGAVLKGGGSGGCCGHGGCGCN
jgi:putative FmdB family regulatory protein